jgi:hypothetical protein
VVFNGVTLGLVVVACVVNSTTDLLGPPHGGLYFLRSAVPAYDGGDPQTIQERGMKTRPSSQPRAFYRYLLTLAAGTLLVALPLSVLAAAGDLDTTFDRDGKVSPAIDSVVVRERRIRVAQTGDDKGVPGRKGGRAIEEAAPGARMGSRCPDECSNECCKNCRGCVCCSNPDMRAPLDNASRIKGGYKPLPHPKRHADPE